MNNDLKNVFSFIKEVLELKSKNIYRLSDYEIHEDLGQFYNDFKEFVDGENYLSLNINSETPILELKYIRDDKKKKIPEVPNELQNFVFIKDKNDLISKIDDLELTLEKKGLLNSYKQLDEEIKEINKYNNLIDTYNSKYMQFYNIYKRINDYEEKIEIIFGHKLLVWSDNQNNKIERYIYEANLDINLDPINNIISLSINNEKKKGFVSDFLNCVFYQVKDSIAFNNYIKEFNDNKINDDFDINLEAKKYINYISFENEIINRQRNLNEKIKFQTTYLFNNCGIIVRNKNVKLWIEDLENIISMCDNTKFNSPILNMFEVDFSNNEQVEQLLNDNTYEETKDDEVLFPLPSNDEQYKIVDKVKSSNIVLVQGPPGTGKSHTIANLLSHYISEGKKVIVTSEKAKALEVLRDKIPSAIRSLSLSLLTSSGVDKNLEFSINSILKHQEEDAESSQSNIKNLTNKLKINHQEKQDINRKIIELMSKDTACHNDELKELIKCESESSNLTLMEIAKWLEYNKNFSIIPINDSENYKYSNPLEFFERLDDICDDIKNNNYAISSNIPEYEQFKANDIELYIKENLGYKNYILFKPELKNFIKQSGLNEKVIINIRNLLDKLANIYKYFDKEFIKSNIDYEVFITNLNKISKIIDENKNFIISTEVKIYDYDIDCNEELNDVLDNIKELINLYDENGNLRFLGSFKMSSLLKRMTNFKLNGKNLQKEKINKTMLIDIQMIISYYIIVDEIRSKIKQVFGFDLFEKMSIKKNQFGRYQEQVANIINGVINFQSYANEMDFYFEQVINVNLFPFTYLDKEEDFINSIYEDLKYYVTEISYYKNTEKKINDIRNFYKKYNLQNLEKTIISIKNNCLEEYISNKNQLIHEIEIINKYNNLKKDYFNFVEDKKELIDNYIYKMKFEDRKNLKLNLDNILKYHYVEKYYLALEEKFNNLPNLYEKRNALIKEEQEIIKELIVTKGWYNQNSNMNYNISSSLNKWVNLKKKLGSGKGKNANLYLRQMREEMNSAKNSIPIWIMPIDKLIEQYPFTNEPPFDVLIMDESSQSSVFSVSALSRAKKVIIVGDDKQISPSDTFVKLEEINNIRTKYLKDNSLGWQISKDTSIYDIIKIFCGNKKITLTEHFRCLPEIINYSNKEFYNMEINPLKIRGIENTISKPIKTVYVPDAVCKRSDNQIINEAEINRIVMLISEISADKEYDNKSIGIITLQNNMLKYIQRLRSLIMNKFGEEFNRERDIKIGNAYDFQGDERDVIILAMGVSSLYENGEKYAFNALTKKEFDRSFNVATSRAKEQMILVYSVKIDELNPDCNRYKLLNYCLNYDLEKEKNNEKLFESNFEKDIYHSLTSKGYSLKPQFKIGKYRIDFVLISDSNQKIAIECDGDSDHGINELEDDLKRQSILERCGWKFFRIRASEYYYDREKSITKLIDLIEHYLKDNEFITYEIDNNSNS